MDIDSSANLPSAGLPQPAARAMPLRRPDGCDYLALVLQGGGALGAYQGGVYQALHEAGRGGVLAGCPR